MNLNQRWPKRFFRTWFPQERGGTLAILPHLARRAEKRLVYFRLFVIALNSFLFFLLPDNLVTNEPLAHYTIMATWIYALGLVSFQSKGVMLPEPAKWATYLCDGLMLTLWIAATGGFASPFYLIYYLCIVSFAFGNRKVLVYSFGFIYALLYTSLMFYTGDFEPTGLIFRCAVMIFAAFIGEIVVTESVAQFVDREKYKDRILETEKMREFFVGMQEQLEAGVKQRTAELAVANSRLDAEIAKRIEIEKALKMSIAETERANLAKAEFLANISHEIRTPLNAVIGYSELLVESHFKPKERDNYAKAVRKNGRLLGAIIGDILDLSKIVNGVVHLEKNQVDVSALLAEVADLFAFDVLNKSLELKFSISKSTPSVISADQIRLKQILVNLVGNAVKFTQYGSVNVNVSVIENSRFLSFSVVDTGIGIPPNRHGRIFEPFTQVDSSISKKFSGTGLGLTISRALAEKMGGRLTLKNSEIGHGSTFSLDIPALDSFLSIEETVNQSASKKPLSSLKILLVDDALDNQVLLKRLLSSHGARAVDLAADGLEGIRLGSTNSYDLILMDLQMPRIDGFQATRSLRQAGVEVPIIAVTAHAMAQVKERVMVGGFTDFIAKPVLPSVLIATILNALREKSAPDLLPIRSTQKRMTLETATII